MDDISKKSGVALPVLENVLAGKVTLRLKDKVNIAKEYGFNLAEVLSLVMDRSIPKEDRGELYTILQRNLMSSLRLRDKLSPNPNI